MTTLGSGPSSQDEIVPRRPWYVRHGWILLGLLCAALAVMVGFVGLLVGIDEAFAARKIFGVASGLFLTSLLAFAIAMFRLFVRQFAGGRRNAIKTLLVCIAVPFLALLLYSLLFVARGFT